MPIRNLVAVGFITLAGVWVAADETPKPTGLAESVEKRLVQLDVAVEGDPDAIRALTAKDFTLYVGEHEIQGLVVDRLCGDEPGMPPSAQSAGPTATSTPKPDRPRATYVLFFDQPHLTTMGRNRAVETSREIINRLVVDGSRAAIVSNAKRMETIVSLTTDRERLLAGLDRLQKDPRQWDSYADSEPSRVREVRDVFAGTYMARCPPLIAKAYEREEFLIARRSTQRLAVAAQTIATATAPKALVYFGDTLRQHAGLHYLHIVPCSETFPDLFREVDSAEMVPSAAAEFDAVVNAALARGVHFYTIQAAGLLVPRPGLATERHRHAQDALVGLAAATGGEAFLGGASDVYIAKRIEILSSCRLLLSFPPGNLPRDKPMNVTLTLGAPKVKIRSQGRIVVPSAIEIERSRLLTAFVDPSSSDDGSLRALLIPRGGDGKRWRASIQLRLRPTGLPDNSAELGASIVRRDKVSEHFAASISTASGTREMVLERSLDLTPGDFSIVAVARDAKRGDVGSTRLEAAWPNPAKSAAAIVPIAVLQMGPAAMSKDGAVSAMGSIARDDDEMLDPSVGMTLASVVCRGTTTQSPVVVDRWLEGGPRDGFVPMTIEQTGRPCVQVVDVVPAGRLQPGVVDYRIVARIGAEIVAQERKTLRVGTKP